MFLSNVLESAVSLAQKDTKIRVADYQMYISGERLEEYQKIITWFTPPITLLRGDYMKFINVLQNKNVYADGIHDDTKVLQACIDEVKDGGTVYFPDGTYLISAALIFYSNQISVQT